MFLVQDPQDSENHQGEQEGVDQGSELVGTENSARGELEEGVALGYHSGADESHQRVHPHGLERLEGLAAAFKVDDVHQEGQGQHRPASSEEDVGGGPQRLRDRDPDTQYHGQQERAAAIDKGPQCHPVRRIPDLCKGRGGRIGSLALHGRVHPVPRPQDHRTDQIAQKTAACSHHRAQKAFRVEIGPAVAMVAVVAADQPLINAHRHIPLQGECTRLTAECQEDGGVGDAGDGYRCYYPERFLEPQGEAARYRVSHPYPLKHAEYPLVLQPVKVVLAEGPGRVVRLGREEGVEVEEQADKEDQGSPLQNFEVSLQAGLLVLAERECHGAAHAEDEEGIDKVRRGAAFPACMTEDGIHVGPGSGVVHDAHEGNGDSTEHIEGGVAFFHDSKYRVFAAIW